MMRLRLGTIVLAVSAVLASSSICFAADTAPAKGPSTPLANPLAPVGKLAGIFRKTTGLKFSSTLTYTTTSVKTGKPDVKHLDVAGEFSKPDMFYYRTTKSGTIVSDGLATIAEDSALLHYARYTSLHGFDLGANWAFVSHRVMKGNAPLLNYSMVGYLFGHITDHDFFHPENMTVTGSSTTLDGKPTQDVEYKDAEADVHLYFDPVTGNPTGTDSTYFVGANQTFEVRETIAKLTLSTTALPASDFLTAPPPGAVFVPIPVPKVARPKSRATPKRPRAARNKQWRNIGGIWVYE